MTTIYDGDSVVAAITGGYSMQVTTLGIPGPPGPPGQDGQDGTGTGGGGPEGNTTAYELRGTGFPEGVVVASPGTYYTDSAITNGAVRWVKITGTGNTGWDVVHGDTGWRNLTLDDPTLTSEPYAVRVRRKNEAVYFQTTIRINLAKTGSGYLWVPVSGFRGRQMYWNMPITGGPTLHNGFILSGGIYYGCENTAHYIVPSQWTDTSYNYTGSLVWSTIEPWPVTLPGAPI